MHVRPVILLTALTLTASAQTHTTHRTAASDDTAIHNVFWQPNDLHQGSPLFVTVELDRPARRVTGNFVNKTITFFSDSPDKKTWHALSPESISTLSRATTV